MWATVNSRHSAEIWHYICQLLFKLKFCANFLPPVRKKTCPAKLRLPPFAAVWPILTFVQYPVPTGSHLCSAWCHFCAEDDATEFSHLSPKRWYCAKGRVGGICALQRWIVMMTWHWQLCTASKTILPKESTSDNDDEHDHSSEGFFLQCGAVPASIMPTSDPLSVPFALSWAAHSTINTALNYLHWVQWMEIFEPVCTTVYSVQQNLHCTEIFAPQLCTAYRIQPKRWTDLEKRHTWNCDGQPST